MSTPTKQFSIFCDLDGKITQILQDENHFLSPSMVGSMLFSIVVPGDLDKILNFFLELKKNKTAIGWEINIATPAGAKTLTFFGGIFEDRIGIAAANTKNGAQLLFAELTRINNEQTNMIRALAKENAQLHSRYEEPPVEYYEELSRLNNDLVNMQRELAKKNRELDELNKIKNQFLGIAAHDLRSPLGVIIGYSDYILDDDNGHFSKEHVMMLNAILTSSEFMLRLINNLLDVSAIESGNMELELSKTDLSSLIKRNVALNKVIAQKKNIQIHFNDPGQISEILIDSGKIEQVLNNLISNAVKYSFPDTTVQVNVSQNDSEVIVSVTDQGQGIPELELGKLFKPFEKTSVQSTAGEKSTGLGLSIVKNLVLGHRGRIWVESKVGEGSTFYFSLPLANMA